MQTGQPGPDDDFRLRRQDTAQACAGNGRLVGAADVHEGHIPVHQPAECCCYLVSRRHAISYLFRTLQHKYTYMSDNLLFAVATIIAGLAVAGIARMVVRWLEKFAETTETKWDDIIVAAIGTPVQVGIVAHLGLHRP